MMLSFCVLHFNIFDRGLRFWSGLLVLKFTAAVGVFTWAYFLELCAFPFVCTFSVHLSESSFPLL